MFLFVCLLVGWHVLPFVFCGIIVKPQRVTGPELIVINDYNRIPPFYEGKKVITSELFTSNDLDTQSRPLKTSNYIIYGEIDYVVHEGRFNFYSYKVFRLLPEKLYIFELIFFSILVLILIKFLLNKIRTNVFISRDSGPLDR